MDEGKADTRRLQWTFSMSRGAAVAWFMVLALIFGMGISALLQVVASMV